MLPLLLPVMLRPPVADVLFFITPDCPISRKYAPEMERIRKAYAGRRVRCQLVFVDAQATSTTAAAWAKAYGVGVPLKLDPKQTLAQRLRVNVVPTAVVQDPAGRVRYFGRIDDRFPALRAERKSAAHTDLRDALDDLVAGRPVRHPRTEPVGCALPRP